MGKITNYRTWVSGITPQNMVKSKPNREALEEVHKILKGKILVGHSLKHDFSVLELKEDVTNNKFDKSLRPDLYPNEAKQQVLVCKDKIRDIAKFRRY